MSRPAVPNTDERCICGDLEPAHARIHCPVHGLFAGLTREQLRERAEAAEARCARLEDELEVALGDKDECWSRLAIERNRCARLQQALRLTLAGIPDPMHPAIPRKMADRIVAAQIVALDALGENDGCDVEKAREALAGLDTPADSRPEENE